MSDDHYYIRREEWAEVRDTVRRIEAAVIGFLEREKASDAAIVRAQSTADQAQKDATEALSRVALLELGQRANAGKWSNVTGLAFKIIGTLIGAGIIGAVGFFVGGGA